MFGAGIGDFPRVWDSLCFSIEFAQEHGEVFWEVELT